MKLSIFLKSISSFFILFSLLLSSTFGLSAKPIIPAFDHQDTLGYVGHKAAHAGLGAGITALKGGDRNEMLSGAMGAVVGEMVAEYLSSDAKDQYAQGRMSRKSLDATLEHNLNITKLAVITTAMLTGLPHETALEMAENSVRHNGMEHVDYHPTPEHAKALGEKIGEVLGIETDPLVKSKKHNVDTSSSLLQNAMVAAKS